jgi:hypothetical protein
MNEKDSDIDTNRQRQEQTERQNSEDPSALFFSYAAHTSP